MHPDQMEFVRRIALAGIALYATILLVELVKVGLREAPLILF